MQSFDTDDSNTLESFYTFSTKASEVEQPDIDFVESSDRKFEGFDTKDSELDPSDNDFVETFDRKFEITDEEALPDLESFDTKGTNVSIPNFDKYA